MAFAKTFPRERDCYVLFKGDAYPVRSPRRCHFPRVARWPGGAVIDSLGTSSGDLF